MSRQGKNKAQLVEQAVTEDELNAITGGDIPEAAYTIGMGIESTDENRKNAELAAFMNAEPHSAKFPDGTKVIINPKT